MADWVNQSIGMISEAVGIFLLALAGCFLTVAFLAVALVVLVVYPLWSVVSRRSTRRVMRG